MDSVKQDRVKNEIGFIAALDQSGGSTPKALKLYGIEAEAYPNQEVMLDLVHEMRTRIITSPSFDGAHILGAILFEDTMNRYIEGTPTGDYLWDVKGIVPFLKIDKGLAEETHGAQVMKPIPDLNNLLKSAVSKGMFGTKMRSLIKEPGQGLHAVVAQQFAIAQQILEFGLVPIVEPEVDIHSARKAETEKELKAALQSELDHLGEDQSVILKLTLPEVENLYHELVEHPRVLRVLALSGGYSRAEATARLVRHQGVIASFSRALTEGLTVTQSDSDFDVALGEATVAIANASRT